MRYRLDDICFDIFESNVVQYNDNFDSTEAKIKTICDNYSFDDCLEIYRHYTDMAQDRRIDSYGDYSWSYEIDTADRAINEHQRRYCTK